MRFGPFTVAIVCSGCLRANMLNTPQRHKAALDCYFDRFNTRAHAQGVTNAQYMVFGCLKRYPKAIGDHAVGRTRHKQVQHLVLARRQLIQPCRVRRWRVLHRAQCRAEHRRVAQKRHEPRGGDARVGEPTRKFEQVARVFGGEGMLGTNMGQLLDPIYVIGHSV